METIKKIFYSHGPTWDISIKKIFPCKYMKEKIYEYMDSSIKKNFLTTIKKFILNYKKISSEL